MYTSVPRSGRIGRVALVAATVASLTLVPVTATYAQAGCLVAGHQAHSWSDGDGSGGFVTEIVVSNVCDAPVDGWTLELTLPPGHALSFGWSADWTGTGGQLTATALAWNRVLNPGGSTTLGFLGTWTGAYQEPLSCTINGGSCDGAPGGNEAPEVTLTRPLGGTVGIVSPCPFVLSADASDPDGAIDRVEFYVNNVLVGTDHTAPYLVGITHLPTPAPPSWEYVAFARAYDDGNPQASSDSEPVAFSVAIGDPVPETMFACMSSVELAAGSSEEVRFALFSSAVSEVTLTVSGDPGVTVSPTTVTASGNLVLVTVSAAPGSAGATATITAAAGELRPASMSVTVS